MKPINLMSQRFGRLTVIDSAPNNKFGHTCWKCLCDCGNTIVTETNDLRRGHTKSCGCLQKETVCKLRATHKLSKTRIYKVWQDMKARCYNKNNKFYDSYGKRGISVCQEWRNSFEEFHKWAESTGYSDSLTLDRIDVNGNYNPENCKWSTIYEQASNRRTTHYVTYHGETDSFDNMCRKLNVNSKTIRGRMRSKNRTFEEAIDNFESCSPFIEYWKK